MSISITLRQDGEGKISKEIHTIVDDHKTPEQLKELAKTMSELIRENK